MAVTKAPLFGLDASGTLGGSIVFSKWKGRTYVRRHAVPANPKSGLQVGMRAGFKFVSETYSGLSDAIKARWKLIGEKTQTTPLNAQMKLSQENIRIGKGCVKDPDAIAGTTPTAPATLLATALPKSLLLTWAHPVTTPGDYSTMIWIKKKKTETPPTPQKQKRCSFLLSLFFSLT